MVGAFVLAVCGVSLLLGVMWALCSYLLPALLGGVEHGRVSLPLDSVGRMVRLPDTLENCPTAVDTAS